LPTNEGGMASAIQAQNNSKRIAKIKRKTRRTST